MTLFPSDDGSKGYGVATPGRGLSPVPRNAQRQRRLLTLDDLTEAERARVAGEVETSRAQRRPAKPITPASDGQS